MTCLALRKNAQGVSTLLSLSFIQIESYCGQLACTTASGFALIEANSTLRYMCKPIPSHHQPHTRFNDGACDSQGRYVAGTLYSPRHNVPGRLYLYDPQDGSCRVIDDGPFTVGCSRALNDVLSDLTSI